MVKEDKYKGGKFDALEEFYNKGYLNEDGIKFYNSIKELEKNGWFEETQNEPKQT